MGAWETGSFDNDDALDWVNEFTDAPNLGFIQETLQAVTQLGNDYLEAPECCMAIAAAEVVAALNGAPASPLPEELRECLKESRLKADASLVALALAAIERVKTNSELQELWAENEAENPHWLAVIAELEARLKQT